MTAADLEGGATAGVETQDGLGGWAMLRELAFEPSRGYHAVVCDSPLGPRVSVKGAREIVLPRCSTWRRPDGPVRLDRRVRARLDKHVERLASQGSRALAVAERPASPGADLGDERIAGMELVGFLALADVVRPTAAAAVASRHEDDDNRGEAVRVEEQGPRDSPGGDGQSAHCAAEHPGGV
jgi:cation-transporting ATPase I